MSILPHRDPFLFVDRIVECRDGERIVGVKDVTTAEADRVWQCPYIIIEALAQVSVILASRSMAEQRKEGDLFFFAGIQSARFDSVPAAGEQVTLLAELQQIRRGIGWFKGTARAGERELVTVKMQAALKGTA